MKTATVEPEILSRLEGVRQAGSGWEAQCPAHDDRRASLCIGVGDEGRTLVKCQAGCETQAVVSAVGLTMKDLMPSDNGHSGNGFTIARTYNYRGEDGDLLYQVCRLDPKDFRQRQPSKGGGWSWSVKDVRKVPYRLPELVAADPQTVAFMPEGEKDCDRLAGLGLVATCNAGGAGKWRSEYAEYLRGRHVVILPDNDDPGRKHAAKVASTLQGKAASVKILELPDVPEKGDVSDWLANGGTAEKLIKLVDGTAEWEPTAKPTNELIQSGLPEIDAGNEHLPTVTQQAWAAIRAANDPPRLFRYGGRVVRTETGDEGELLLRDLSVDRMRFETAKAATWFRWKKHGEDIVKKEATPPDKVVKNILATPNIDLPVLIRVVETPVFAPDGTLQTEAGYHAASRTFYAPAAGFSVPSVPENPTREDVDFAADQLAHELIGDFPFIGDAERAHAVALALLPFARDLIDSATPFHLIEKPSPGTGATLLVDMLTYPAVGRPLSAMTEGRDEDEWRKRVTAKLRSGAAFLLIDNLRRRLDSAALSAAITSLVWEDRILGLSETIKLPVRCAWIGTGNNPSLSSEMARRTVRIRLDAKIDRPWLREGFRHPDLREWARNNRGQLVWAALTLIRAWIVAGRPKGPTRLGMFESWSETMGGILQVAGIDGFLSNLDEFYNESDAEGNAVRGFLAAWWERYGGMEVKVKNLWVLSENCDLNLGTGTEQSQKVRLGKALAGMRDRVYTLTENPTDGGGAHSGRLQVCRLRMHQGAYLWKLNRIGD